MTVPDQAVISRLSADFAAMASYMARASADLRELQRIVAERAPQPAQQYWPQVPVAPPAPVKPPAPLASAPPRSEGWIGRVLAVAGVAVTLIGVVLLVVLAAQAGLLRPEFRVGAGAVLAGALVGAGWWLNTRPGGRIGAIALAATGIAAAYIDVIAVTTIYGWVPAPVGLVLAAVVAGGGLTLARRWDSEHLGLLVLVPLIGLGPVVTGGITLLLVGFMLALSAASLPVQLGKDWTALHGARVAAATLPLLIALAAVHPGRSPWLAGACAIAAALAIASALILLPRSSRPVPIALLAAVGTAPVLAVSAAAGRVTSALMAAVLAAVLLAIVLVGDRLPNVTGAVRNVWSALSAAAALNAVAVAFDGPVAAPLLLAMAVVVAVAGRANAAARWSAVAFGAVGVSYYLGYASLETLLTATARTTPVVASTLVASVLLVACAIVIIWSWAGSTSDADVVRLVWAGAAVVGMYAITMFTVTTGVLFGADHGFLAGHMAATICWIVLAAGVFRYAVKLPRAKRSLPIGGGMALVAAAVAKLFLFDLGTLDGIFRVIVFIVVGLVLLGIGAGYARLLAQQDQHDQPV
jgi:uncharacterized membrane protein